MSVDLAVPAIIDENNLYLYDPNSDFYNDICYIYTSGKRTDLTREDRKKEFIENNRALCEEDCEFKGYDSKNKKALCKCLIKINLLKISEISIDKTKLYNSFAEFSTVINFEVMKCYHILFTKNGMLNNIGVYILIPIISLQIIFLIIFYNKDYNDIKNKIYQIIYIKKNWKYLKEKLLSKTQNDEIEKRSKKRTFKNIGKKKKSEMNLLVLEQIKENEVKKDEDKNIEQNNQIKKDEQKLEIKNEIKVENNLNKKWRNNRY